jgi:MFS family permease
VAVFEREASVAGAPGEAGRRPTTDLPVGHLARISLYWLGLTAIDGAVGVFTQNRLNYDGFASAAEVGRILFLLSIPVAVLSILIQPTIGAISDYTTSRWGRRKPYIVFGSLLDVVFLAGIATASNVLILGVFVAFLAISTNIARGPFQGYVPDLIAERQVGMASALVGLMQILGNVTGFLLVTIAVALDRIELAIVAVAVVELLTMIAVVVRVSPGVAALDRGGRSWIQIAGTAWGADILRERSYVWLVVSRLFFLMGGAMLVNLVITYLKQTHHLLQDEANGTNTILLVVVVLANLIAIVPSARISDRIGRKPVIYASCVVGAVGLAIAALAPSVAFLFVGAFLFGASAGTFLAVDWALITDIIPRASSGRYMGLSNVATGSSTVLAVMTGGLTLDFVNAALGEGAGPRAAYLLGAAYYVVAMVCLRPVVEPPRRAPVAEAGPARAAGSAALDELVRDTRRSAGFDRGPPVAGGAVRQTDPRPGTPDPRAAFGSEGVESRPPPAGMEPVERRGSPPQVRHERPQEHDVVEPERTPPEPEQRLELGDRAGQGRDAQEDRHDQEQQAPQPGAGRQDEQEYDRHPLHPARDRPERAGEERAAEQGAPQEEGQGQVDVAGVEVRAEREAEQRDQDRRLERPLAIRPVDRPEQEEDRPAPPDVPGDVPREKRPGREQRQHPWGVDVRQEGAGRPVRVAAAEPDPDGRPVRSGIRAGRLATGHQAGRDAPERDDQQGHGEDPAPVVQATQLLADRPAGDGGPAAVRAGRDGRARDDGAAPVLHRCPVAGDCVPRAHPAAFWQTAVSDPAVRRRPWMRGSAILPRSEPRSARP